MKIERLARICDSETNESAIQKDIDKVIVSLGEKWDKWNESDGIFDLYPDLDNEGYIIYEETFAENSHVDEVESELKELGYSLDDNDNHHDSYYFYFKKEKE